MFSVLQTGQFSKLLVLSHSVHIAICPQLQNKTLGGLFRQKKSYYTFILFESLFCVKFSF